jgi:hypothetical protein
MRVRFDNNIGDDEMMGKISQRVHLQIHVFGEQFLGALIIFIR